MDHFAWQGVPQEQLNPQLRRRVFHGSNITVAQLELAEGAVVPEHQHHNEQISMVASGSLRFEFPDEHVTVGAGEALRIAPHRPHRVIALEDTSVTDIFAPVREDWRSGDDAYLRK
jgi:quercetin dioxygenase-like cupin family protein